MSESVIESNISEDEISTAENDCLFKSTNESFTEEKSSDISDKSKHHKKVNMTVNDKYLENIFKLAKEIDEKVNYRYQSRKPEIFQNKSKKNVAKELKNINDKLNVKKKTIAHSKKILSNNFSKHNVTQSTPIKKDIVLYSDYRMKTDDVEEKENLVHSSVNLKISTPTTCKNNNSFINMYVKSNNVDSTKNDIINSDRNFEKEKNYESDLKNCCKYDFNLKETLKNKNVKNDIFFRNEKSFYSSSDTEDNLDSSILVLTDKKPPYNLRQIKKKYNTSTLETTINYKTISHLKKNEIEFSDQKKSNFKSLNLENEVLSLKKQLSYLKKKNLDLKISINDFEMKNLEKNIKENQIDDKSTSIFFDYSNFSNTSPNQNNNQIKIINDLKNKNVQLSSELLRYKNNHKELMNEFNWLKKNKSQELDLLNQKAILKLKSEFEKSLENKKTENEKLKKKIKITDLKILSLNSEIFRLKKEIGDTSQMISEKKMDKKFISYYSKLGLNKVDSLNKVELSNLIKNLMLSLLISDFDNLPNNAIKIGKFLKLSIQFIDKLFDIICVIDKKKLSYFLKPSHYLDSKMNHLESNLLKLKDCLNTMTEIVMHKA